MSGGDEVAPAAVAELGRGPARGARAKWAAALFGGWMLARGLGAAAAPALLAQSPLALLALSPAWTNLILVSALVEPAIFIPTAMVVTAAQAALGYQVGRWWGSDALVMFERRPEGVVARVRRMVARAAPAMVFAVPGPLVCTMAGIIGLRPRLFYPVMIVAKALWLTLCLMLGEALGEQIRALAALAREHVVWLTALAACWVLARVGGKRWAARRRAARVNAGA